MGVPIVSGKASEEAPRLRRAHWPARLRELVVEAVDRIARIRCPISSRRVEVRTCPELAAAN